MASTMATAPPERDANASGEAGTSIASVVAAAKASVAMRAPQSSSATATATALPTLAAGFQVVVSGQLDSISYPGVGNLYCRYAVTYGTDWRVLHGADAGLTQLAHRSSHDEAIVFNFPIDISFKSTNPFGWPRLVFSVYGLDALGRDVVRGYGSTHIPISSGKTYFDAKFVAQTHGREVTRVTSEGMIKVSLNVFTVGMTQYGYAASA